MTDANRRWDEEKSRADAEKSRANAAEAREAKLWKVIEEDRLSMQRMLTKAGYVTSRTEGKIRHRLDVLDAILAEKEADRG